jgi:type I restriction enzyme R subunit
MARAGIVESTVESAALAWLSELGWQVKHSSEIAPDGLFAERQDYGQVVLNQRLRDALARLNPDLPPEALQDAFRKLVNPPGATLEQRNRALHRMLVDGVDGGIPATGRCHRWGAGSRARFRRPRKTTTGSR